MNIQLEILPHNLSVCKLKNITDIDLTDEFFFIGKTDEEISLVCTKDHIPSNTISEEHGWRSMRICGMLDFSLIGIISKISAILANNSIGIFVVSTYNTDYILIKEYQLEKAITVLTDSGYIFK